MSSKKAQKSASGSGSIRQRTVVSRGKTYTYWEARFISGYHPGTGKPISRSISGKTQREVALKLREATAAVDTNTFLEPTKLTIGQWLDIWAKEYLCNLKPNTAYAYRAAVANNIKPNIGALKLNQISPHDVQTFYNEL